MPAANSGVNRPVVRRLDHDAVGSAMMVAYEMELHNIQVR